MGMSCALANEFCPWGATHWPGRILVDESCPRGKTHRLGRAVRLSAARQAVGILYSVGNAREIGGHGSHGGGVSF